MRFAPPRRAGVDITLTPLIDILFIVLLFLVLTATFTEQTVLRISLPRTATGIHDSGDPGAMRILVDAAGSIFVDRVRQAGIFRLEIETFSGSAQNGSS